MTRIQPRGARVRTVCKNHAPRPKNARDPFHCRDIKALLDSQESCGLQSSDVVTSGKGAEDCGKPERNVKRVLGLSDGRVSESRSQ